MRNVPKLRFKEFTDECYTKLPSKYIKVCEKTPEWLEKILKEIGVE